MINKIIADTANSWDREGFLVGEINTVIFDFDGLLVDTETCMFKAWEALMKPYGVSVSIVQMASLVGSSEQTNYLYEQYRQASKSAETDSSISQRVHAMAYKFIEGIAEREGVREYLDYATKHSLKIGLATSSEQSHYMPILKRLKLDHYFDCFVGAEQIAATSRKPHPDVYLMVLKNLGVSAKECIAFEDSPPGVKAARSAGILTVAVTNSLTHNLDVSNANITLSSMSEQPLPQLLTQLTETKL